MIDFCTICGHLVSFSSSLRAGPGRTVYLKLGHGALYSRYDGPVNYILGTLSRRDLSCSAYTVLSFSFLSLSKKDSRAPSDLLRGSRQR